MKGGEDVYAAYRSGGYVSSGGPGVRRETEAEGVEGIEEVGWSAREDGAIQYCPVHNGVGVWWRGGEGEMGWGH